MAKVTVKYIKRTERQNITFSITTTCNLTGSITECLEFFSPQGTDLSTYILESKSTSLLDIELGTELLKITERIFQTRRAHGDLNPVIEITYYCNSIVQNHTGYYIAGVQEFKVVNEEEYLPQEIVEDLFDEEDFIANAERIKHESLKAKAAAMESALEARFNRPIPRVTNLNNAAISQTTLPTQLAGVEVTAPVRTVIEKPRRRI